MYHLDRTHARSKLNLKFISNDRNKCSSDCLLSYIIKSVHSKLSLVMYSLYGKLNAKKNTSEFYGSESNKWMIWWNNIINHVLWIICFFFLQQIESSWKVSPFSPLKINLKSPKDSFYFQISTNYFFKTLVTDRSKVILNQNVKPGKKHSFFIIINISMVILFNLFLE